MKKNEIIELIVTDIAYPKSGSGLYDGARVFAKGALPGQTVEARLTKTRGRVEAGVCRVLKPAPNEVASDCPSFGVCGGCAFRTLPYKEEARLKEQMARALFDGFGYAYDGFTAAGDPTAYRNKMEFAFGDDGPDGNLTLGMRKRGSYYETVNADGCLLCHADFGAVVKATREFFAERGGRFYHRARKTGTLRHLCVRRGATGELLVNLVTAPDCGLDLEGFADMIAALPLRGEAVSIWHTENDAVADVVKPDGARLLRGKPYFEETLSGLRFRVTPFSFFQTNTAEAARLYETALSFAGGGEALFDLYCGTGTIAQLAAARGIARRVTGVEIVPEAVEAARASAVLNGIGGCTFIAGDVLKTIPELPELPDILILDPPREGVHPKALPRLAAFGAARIVYVSCNPVTLARDARILEGASYAFTRLRFHDLFPRAAHVESVALFTRVGSVEKS